MRSLGSRRAPPLPRATSSKASRRPDEGARCLPSRPAIAGSQRRSRRNPRRRNRPRRRDDGARASTRRPPARPARALADRFAEARSLIAPAGHRASGRTPVDPQIDLAQLKAGRFEGEIEVEALQLLKLDAKPPVVPGGELAKPVVGKHEGSGLGFAQMIERDGRNLPQAQAPGGEQPPVTRQHPALPVDQNGRVEAEGRDAVGDAGDLASRVYARVSGIGRERVRGKPADMKPRGRLIATGHEDCPLSVPGRLTNPDQRSFVSYPHRRGYARTKIEQIDV